MLAALEPEVAVAFTNIDSVIYHSVRTFLLEEGGHEDIIQHLDLAKRISRVSYLFFPWAKLKSNNGFGILSSSSTKLGHGVEYLEKWVRVRRKV